MMDALEADLVAEGVTDEASGWLDGVFSDDEEDEEENDADDKMEREMRMAQTTNYRGPNKTLGYSAWFGNSSFTKYSLHVEGKIRQAQMSEEVNLSSFHG